jgi:D-glycero-alpha-D-manno-heptose-7-phosphate kinase
MIISRTPYRISFFGGGTDYPAWYRDHGGTVLGVTIDKYCYLTCRYLPPFFKHRIRIVYSRIENCKSVDDICHPAVREVLRHLEIDRGLEIHHDGDLPARSGMGSSSSFTVGLLHALHALKGFMPSKRQLALEGIEIEQERLKETVGSQDQVLAAHGGFNHVVFHPNGEIAVRPVTLSAERLRELNDHLMLFYTGIERTASNIAETYVSDGETKKSQLRIMKHLVEEGLAILNNGSDIADFGELLHEAWQVKRGLSSKVSNAHVDELYEHARGNGALGGKLLGAGGGGFMLLFVPPSKQSRVREALQKFICVPFHFESSGSQVVFYEPERDYSAEDKARSLQEFNFIGEIEEEEFLQVL